MHEADIEKPWTEMQPNGKVRTFGVGFPRSIHSCLNIGTGIIYAGDPVRAQWLGGSADEPQLGRWNYNGREHIPVNSMRIVACSDPADRALIGVALEDIYPGKIGRVAGCGSLIPVCCMSTVIAAAPGNYVVAGTAGVPTGATETHGMVDYTTVAPPVGSALGIVVQRAGVGVGTTGSFNYVGILISPR